MSVWKAVDQAGDADSISTDYLKLRSCLNKIVSLTEWNVKRSGTTQEDLNVKMLSKNDKVCLYGG